MSGFIGATTPFVASLPKNREGFWLRRMLDHRPGIRFLLRTSLVLQIDSEIPGEQEKTWSEATLVIPKAVRSGWTSRSKAPFLPTLSRQEPKKSASRNDPPPEETGKIAIAALPAIVAPQKKRLGRSPA